MPQLKQSSTAQPLVFLLVLTSDHISGATGLTPTVTLSKNGGAFASPSGAVTEISAGWYKVAGNATDTNTLGPLLLHATGTGADPVDLYYDVVAYDPQDAVALGLSMVPTNVKQINAVATTSVTTVNANQGTTQPLNFTDTGASALVKGDAIDVGSVAQTGRDLGASVLLSAGTGTGQLDFTSGVVKSSLVQILGTALTETAGQIAAAFKKFFNIATPASTMDHLTLLDTVTTYTGNTPQTGDGYAIVNSGSFGNSALLSVIQNVQNNTFIATSIPYTLERPDSSSTSISISIVFSDETGAAKNLDSGSPSITLVNDAGTDRSGRLGSITNPATGKYVVAYTNTSTDTIEGLHWDITGTINSKLRRMVAYTQIVDTTAVDFTSSDRTNLNSVLSTVTTNLDTNVGSRASPTNITGGTITTVTNLTNAPTNGDFTATMKTSLNAATPVAREAINYSICYVDATNGNDSNDGLTWAKAFKTLNAAFLTAAVNYATVVRLAPGTYTVGNWSDMPAYTGITLQGPPDRSAVLTGSVNLANNGVLYPQAGWVLRDVTVTNTNAGSSASPLNTIAIYMTGINDVTFERVTIAATGGVGIFANNCQRLKMIDVQASGMQNGMRLVGCNGWLIRPRCTVTNGWNGSIPLSINNSGAQNTEREMMLVENVQAINEINVRNATTDAATLIYGAEASGSMNVQFRGGHILCRRLIAPTTGTADCQGLIESEGGKITLSDGVLIDAYSIAPGASTYDINTDDSSVTDGHVYAEVAYFTTTTGSRAIEYAPTSFNPTANSSVATTLARIGTPAVSVSADIATRLAASAYTAPDNANIGVAATQATTAATNTGTILNRLGAWTGTGINNVLGAFRAALNKLAGLTPTDLTAGGGTFDNTEDSLEAQHDAGASVTVAGYAPGQDPATLVLDVAASGHNTAGTIGAKINASGASGDPLANDVPGAYAPGTAGYKIGHSSDVVEIIQRNEVIEQT